MKVETSNAPLVYGIAPSRALPCVNLKRTINNTYLSTSIASVVTFMLHHRIIRVLMFVVFIITSFIGAGTQFNRNPSTDPWLCFIAGVGLMWPFTTNFLVTRVDMIRLVMGTFDFWYITISAWFTLIVACFALNDARAGFMIASAIGVDLSLLVDAMVDSNRVFIAMSISAFVFFTSICGLTIGWIPYTTFTILETSQRSLDADDVIVNGLTTLMMLLLRNCLCKMYDRLKRWRYQNTPKAISPLITIAVTYQCHLRLEVQRPVYRSSQTYTEILQQNLKRVQLQVVPHDDIIDHQRIILVSKYHYLLNWMKYPSVCFILHLLGVVGLFTTPLVICCNWNKGISMAMALLSFISTTLFCLIHFCCYQTLLLWHLITSFEFLFVSIQVNLCCWCLSGMMKYDQRVFSVIALWQWIHWVLLMDAITPERKKQLGFHLGFGALIVMVFLSTISYVVVDLLYAGSLDMMDHIIYRLHIGTSEKIFTLVPIYFSRVSTLFCWCLRILWRIYDHQPNELLLLQSRVQFQSRLASNGPTHRRIKSAFVNAGHQDTIHMAHRIFEARSGGSTNSIPESQ